MAILNNSNAISSGGYDINNSLRFRASASAYLSRTPASTGSRQTFTYSFWMKRGTLGTLQRFFGVSDNATGDFILQWTTSNTLEIYDNGPAGTSLITTQVFRDPSAWYHIVITYDTTNATSSNRVRVYVNGSQVTAFGTAVYPAQNTNSFNNQASIPARIGIWPSGSQYFDGYFAEFNFIDGSAKAASDFGETDTTTGSWVAKKYTGTYGTNGFYLKFSDIATTSGSNAGLGKDFSGNTNYWTTNNISVTAGTTYDAMIDSPTLTSATVANYPTLNPLSNTSTLTEANLSASNILQAGTTMATPSTGKWYFEYTQTTSIPSGSLWVGVASNTNAIADNQLQGYAYASDGRKVAYNSYTSGYGATWTNGDVIGCALDLDNQTITFYKNNTSQGTAFTSITAQPYVFALSAGGAASTKGGSINCGQRPFAYTPPSGFVRLNTYNLPDSTIKKGNTVMDATTYTATGTTPQTVTNAGSFKPDLVWTKNRTSAGNHYLNDSVRGATNALNSNTTSAEASLPNYITSFNSNGYGIGSDNFTSGQNIVGWQWQAGQGSTSSNTSGNITSTVSVNATAGFSIVTYTGTGANATVGHGLGIAPSMIFFKQRSGGTARAWQVYHVSMGNGGGMYLNQTNAYSADATAFNSTSPTSSVFSLGSSIYPNQSGSPIVAYCWAEIAGFSKFTSYTGNNSSDGPFVYLGFRPKFVMIKETGNASDWIIHDTGRSTYNVSDKRLRPNLSDAEVSGDLYDYLDILSNGFKLRGQTGSNGTNRSGGTYIVAAWAENPFKNSNAR